MLVLLIVLGACSAPPPIDPHAPEVSTARAEMRAELRQELAGIVAAVGGRLLGVSYIDHCYEGHRDWKRNDGYAHRCTLSLRALLDLDGDLRDHLADLDAFFVASDGYWWTFDDDWPGRMAEEYWDLREIPEELHRIPADQVHRWDFDVTVEFAYGWIHHPEGVRRVDSRERDLFTGSPRYHEVTSHLDMEQALARARGGTLMLIGIQGHYAVVR